MKLSLKQRLLAYLKAYPGWHPKGQLADLARTSELKATGEATGRRLRELEEVGAVEVKYEKNHAYYRFPVKVEVPLDHDLERIFG